MIDQIQGSEFKVARLESSKGRLVQDLPQPRSLPLEHSPVGLYYERTIQHRTRVESGRVFIEKYDEGGRLIEVTPPSCPSLGEIV